MMNTKFQWGVQTPWGVADASEKIAPGIMRYDTPSHGGYHLSQARRAQMPEPYKSWPTFAGGNWYEEDCDWCLVALSFPDVFPGAADAARETFEWMVERRKII